MNNVIGIVNFHTAPSVSPITDARPLGSTSFLGRYAVCDFALSNLCNSGITQVGLLIKDYLRSILKHLGSGDAWVTNTKIGHQRLLYNEPGQRDPRLNTDVRNLMHNDWLLYDSANQYLVFVPTHLVCSMDLRPILAEHIENNRSVTIVASRQKNLKTTWIGAPILQFDDQGKLIDCERNHGQFPTPKVVALDTIVINRTVLLEIIHKYTQFNPSLELIDLIMLAHKEGVINAELSYFDGYVRCIDSFAHYMELSFDLLDRHKADILFRPDWPIYTLTHDTPPALYGAGSEVHNSYISNGALIEGKVYNSIIARNVHIGKGAVIKNSIIFSSVNVHEDAVVENLLIDKYSIVERSHVIKGKPKDPIYVPQGAIL